MVSVQKHHLGTEIIYTLLINTKLLQFNNITIISQDSDIVASEPLKIFIVNAKMSHEHLET